MRPARAMVAAAAGIGGALLLAWLCSTMALLFWHDYAAVFPDRAFTFVMLVARQAVGVVAAIAGGYIASASARQDQRPVLWAGVIGLAGALWIHLHEPTWSQYPVWYHLIFFSYLIPAPLLGGHLNQRFTRSAISAGAASVRSNE